MKNEEIVARMKLLHALPTGFYELYLHFGIVELENGLRASGRPLVENPEKGARIKTLEII